VFESLLVADRGETARRILRTAAQMGLRTVAVHSDADTDLPFVREADDAVLLGAAAPASSYLDVVKILEAARRAGAGAIHPGSGPLAEDAAFARAVTDAGLVWVGPPPEAIDAMQAHAAAQRQPEGGPARYVEVQVLGLTDDQVVALGEWDSSVRRRDQPMVVESPAPKLDRATRAGLLSRAVRLAQDLGLRSAGTVEFLLDTAGDGVEPVRVHSRIRTGQAALELVTGVDVVEEQLRLAGGRPPTADLDHIGTDGHAVELAVYAEGAQRFGAAGGDVLVATLRVQGSDRADALGKAASAIAGFTASEPTNQPFLADAVERLRA
jgi:acetyl/propionyl-CoA carboxylase alpha subunit